MYCARCGVELAKSEKVCPLCGLKAYHPDLPAQTGDGLYPHGEQMEEHVGGKVALAVITALFALAAALTLVVDLKTQGRVTWSGYAIGGMLTFYVDVILPCWFRRPNPVIFVPCGVAAVTVYLLYICLKTGGHWFMPLAFPVCGMAALLLTAVSALLRYLRGGRLYIFGGALIALGGSMMLLEALIAWANGVRVRFVWSPYPLGACCLLGGLLIFTAICKPLREALCKKLFF